MRNLLKVVRIFDHRQLPVLSRQRARYERQIYFDLAAIKSNLIINFDDVVTPSRAQRRTDRHQRWAALAKAYIALLLGSAAIERSSSNNGSIP